MTVVLNEMFVVFFNGEVDVDIPFVCAAGHRRNSDKSLKNQYFRTIPEPEGLVNLTFSRLLVIIFSVH